jgi:hypothetical protein
MMLANCSAESGLATWASKRDQPRLRQRPVLAQQAGEIHTAHIRHRNVDQCEIGDEVIDNRQRARAAVGGAYLVAIEFEQHGEGIDGIGLIVDEENLLGLRHGLEMSIGVTSRAESAAWVRWVRVLQRLAPELLHQREQRDRRGAFAAVPVKVMPRPAGFADVVVIERSERDNAEVRRRQIAA